MKLKPPKTNQPVRVVAKLLGYRVQPPYSYYKSLKSHKNIPKINGYLPEIQNPKLFYGYVTDLGCSSLLTAITPNNF